MKVKYTGDSDSYELDAADFKKGGVEGARKTRFPRGEPVEVEDEVGQLLTESEEGPFAELTRLFKVVSEDEARSSSDDDEEEEDPEMKKGSRDSQSGGTAGGGTTRGGARGNTGAAKKTASSGGTTTTT